MRLRVKKGWFWDIGNNINLVLINFSIIVLSEIFMCRKKKLLYESRRYYVAKNGRFWKIYICYECMNGR